MADATGLDVFHTIQPVMFIEYLFAVGRLFKRKGEIKTANIYFKVFGIIYVIVQIILMYILVEIHSNDVGLDMIYDMHFTPTVTIVIGYVMFVINNNFISGNRNMQMYLRFKKIDKDLNIHFNRDFYRTSRRQHFLILIILFISHSIYHIIEVTLDSANFAIIWGVYFFQDIEKAFFCILIFMIKKRLDIINLHIAKCINLHRLRKADSSLNGIKFNRFDPILSKKLKISELARVYNSIGELCSLINDDFNLNIFFGFMGTFSYVITSIWSVLYYSRPGIHVYKTITLINQLIWIILELYPIVVVCLVSNWLPWTQKKIKVLLNEIIIDYTTPDTIRNEAKSFNELVDVWPLHIFMYKMFRIDVGLLLNFVNLCTTYLIFMLQITHFI